MIARRGAVVAIAALLVAALGFGVWQAPVIFERMLRGYLLDHPEVVVEAIDRYKLREGEQAADRQRALLVARAEELRADPRSPVLGNAGGDVTVVEFFDYKCPFCRQFHPQLAGLLESDPHIRFVLKEFPVLGPESMLAARASVAVWIGQPARFAAFHDLLMRVAGRLDEAILLRVAADTGVDGGALLLDMADPKIDRAIADTHALAIALGLTGTPGFVIGDAVVPGYIDRAEVLRLVEQARQSCMSCRAGD